MIGNLIIGGSSGATIADPLAVGDGGTGTTTQFTQGSVVFAGASGVYTQDNANFFWDDSNNRLGLGSAVPTVVLDVFNNALTTVITPTLRLANTTAATSGATRQFSPALIFSGTAWDTDGAGANVTNRFALYERTVSGTTTSGFLAFADDKDGAGTFTDQFYMGSATSGSTPDFRIRSGNIVFANVGRGISFVTNPLTDTTLTDCVLSGDVSGGNKRLKLTTNIGYVFVEGNNFGNGAGTTPMMDFRGFDDSVSSPIVQIRFRGIPGGTVANGFGSSLLYQATSSTTADQNQGRFDCIWSDVTHASRTAKFNFYLVNSAAALALKFEMLATGVLYTSAATFMIGTRTAYTNGAGGSLGTLTNAPAVGDPTKWIAIDDNGTTRYIPAW